MAGKTAIADLKKALKNKTSDKFKTADVIRWTSGGRYSYAAIKTPVGWYTTAAGYNRYVGMIVSYDELVDVLNGAGVTNIQVATEWEDI